MRFNLLWQFIRHPIQNYNRFEFWRGQQFAIEMAPLLEPGELDAMTKAESLNAFDKGFLIEAMRRHCMIDGKEATLKITQKTGDVEYFVCDSYGVWREVE